MHTYIREYMHTYRHHYIGTYIHTYIAYIRGSEYMQLSASVACIHQTHIHTDIPTYIHTYMHTCSFINPNFTLKPATLYRSIITYRYRNTLIPT